jgi:choline dehydrogenase-like flavoprotein
VLGGSSAINGMMNTRGHRSSYDAWAKSGATEWNYATMLPYLKRSEHTEGKDPNFRGTAGPMRIEESPSPSPLMRALFQAAVDTGLPPADGSNGCRDEGVFWQESNVVAGRRQSAADAYLRPALYRPNLTVLIDALVLWLVMDGSHCRGVEYAANGRAVTITVERDVVLCAGVIGSPQILMLSGRGPTEHLHET